MKSLQSSSLSVSVNRVHRCSSSFQPLLILPSLTPLFFPHLPVHISKVSLCCNSLSLSTPSPHSPLCLSKHTSQPKHVRASNVEALAWENDEEGKSTSYSFEDLKTNGEVYNKTLRLVECSMFAAIGGLAYLLSSSLAIENYFGCFFALPIVFSSMRWDVVAGRKTMVATGTLLLVLSGPVKAITYLLMHGLLGLAMGSLWRYQNPVHILFSIFVHIVKFKCWQVKGKLGCFNCFECICSSNRCDGVRCYILIKRKHPCFDNNKHSCFSYIRSYSCGILLHSINKYNLHPFWNLAFV